MLPEGTKRVPPKNGRVILAEGEAHGHAHAIEQIDDCELYEKDGTLYLSIKKPVTLTHEEHLPQTLEPGIIEVGIVVEYDYFADMIRPVID
jgi:hypothetical protein